MATLKFVSFDNLSAFWTKAKEYIAKQLTDLEITSTDKTVTVSGHNLSVNIDNETIVKDSNGKLSVASKALTMEGADAIKVEDGATGKTVKLNIASGDKVLSQSEAGLLANLELKYTKAADGANGKIELIGKDGNVLGTIDTTDFTVDGMLENAEMEGNNLALTLNTAGGSKELKVDLSKYIDTYTNGDGLELDSTSKKFSVKVKSGDKYLEVTEDGVASKGIDAAIAVETARAEAAEGALDTRMEAVEGMLGITEGSEGETVADKIEDAIEALDATEVSTDGKNVQITVIQTDGKISEVSVSTDNTASSTELAAETKARKDVTGIDGDTYTANSDANYISGATSLNDADKKLDAQAKANAEAIAALSSKVGDDTVEDQVDEALEELTVATIGGEDKLIQSITQTNGLISATYVEFEFCNESDITSLFN